MTSLIDVIFLLLLFFMLSSTFSKFSEIELAAASGQGAAGSGQALFLQVAPETLRLNAVPVALEELSARLADRPEPDAAKLLVSLSSAVSSQRLTDVLVILHRHPRLSFSILAPT